MPVPPESEGWRGDVGLGVRAWAGTREGAARAGAGSTSPDRPGSRRSSGGRSRRAAGSPPDDVQAAGPEADPESVARTILLDQLAGRARSRRELADKLAAKGVPPELATGLLDRFEEVGLVDDVAFARTWVSQRHAGRGLAPRALAQELRRKGVADDVVREAVAEVDDDDQEAAARALVRKRLRSLSRVDDATATRRLVGMLGRKGYSPGLAFLVVRSELAESGRSGPDGDIEPDL